MGPISKRATAILIMMAAVLIGTTAVLLNDNQEASISTADAAATDVGGSPSLGKNRIPVDENGRAMRGHVNRPGRPSYGPHPRDEDGDGMISGEGQEAYPDFMPVYLADGSTALVETKYLLGVDEKGEPLLGEREVPAYSPDGEQVGTYTINDGGLTGDDPSDAPTGSG